MKVDNAVMAVLSTLQFDGHRARIVDQLDRKMYVQVNRVLEAAGGKWDRRAKAHVFGGDARDAIEDVMLTGEVTTHQDIGYFPTPSALAIRLVTGDFMGKQFVPQVHYGKIEAGETVLEPSAGTGRLADAAYHMGALVTCVERDDKMGRALAGRGYVVSIEDFLQWGPIVKTHRWNHVLMNPPFDRRGTHLDHVRHATQFIGHPRGEGTLRAILPQGVLFREDAKHRGFREWLSAWSEGYTFVKLPDDAFAESGTNVRTCVLLAGAP